METGKVMPTNAPIATQVKNDDGSCARAEAPPYIPPPYAAPRKTPGTDLHSAAAFMPPECGRALPI